MIALEVSQIGVSSNDVFRFPLHSSDNDLVIIWVTLDNTELELSRDKNAMMPQKIDQSPDDPWRQVAVFLTDAWAVKDLFHFLDNGLRSDQEKLAIPPCLEDLSRMTVWD